MKPSEIFREAKPVLFERGWMQGNFTDATGALCVEGGMLVACGLEPRTYGLPPQEYGDAVRILSSVVGREAFRWNDDPERTFSEVIDALDKAEKLAEQAEAAS